MPDFGKYEITFKDTVPHARVAELNKQLLPILEELDIEVTSIWAEIRLPE